MEEEGRIYTSFDGPDPDETYLEERSNGEIAAVRIVDALDPDAPLANREIRDKRMDICRHCDRIRDLDVCSECFCVMSLKTWDLDTRCPIYKW